MSNWAPGQTLGEEHRLDHNIHGTIPDGTLALGVDTSIFRDVANHLKTNDGVTIEHGSALAGGATGPFEVKVDTGHAQGLKSRFSVENNLNSEQVDVNFRGVTINIGNPVVADHAGGAPVGFFSPTGSTGQYLRAWAPGEETVSPAAFALGVNGDLVLGVGGLASTALSVKARADANSRFTISEFGRLDWGPGGASALDTNLYRSAANLLATDDNLELTGTFASIKFGGDSEVALSKVGAGTLRLGTTTGTVLEFGTDTNLYRGAANRLKSDDHLVAVDGVQTKYKAGAPVDGDFQTVPTDGTLVVDSTNNKIWARVGGTWKGIVIA